MDTIRVLLADDHAFVRTGIRNILHKTEDIVVIGEATNGAQALDMVKVLEPDVLVLDMEMPGLKGYEVAHRLSEEQTDLPVLALSAYEDRQFILGMLRDGAYGYLTKDEAPESIVRAVRGIAQGERGWVSRRVAAKMAVWLQSEQSESLELGQKELQVLRLIVAGKTIGMVAQALSMDRKEVEARLEWTIRAVRRHLRRGQGEAPIQ